jgi:toxin LF subunit
LSRMPEYDATAGFPQVHITAFQTVASRNRFVISSRELNPLCTDLVLEGYAAKGFHIKAKTCDWGPMAGFVPADYRFTKGSQDIAKQKEEIGNAFGHHALCVPLYISEARLTKLAEHGVVRIIKRTGTTVELEAAPTGGSALKFTLVRLMTAPPGMSGRMWSVNYAPGVKAESAPGQPAVSHDMPVWPGLTPVLGMTNPGGVAALGARAAVAGDYDLWCIFPHESVGGSGISDRLMPLRSTLVGKAAQNPGGLVARQAAAANLIFQSGAQRAALAQQKEDAHLGNISHAVLKVRTELNAACAGAGYTGGNIVQHSDYGGNPFATIDFPLIFFIPDPATQFQQTTFDVAIDQPELKRILRELKRMGYILKLNPAWSIPLL